MRRGTLIGMMLVVACSGSAEAPAAGGGSSGGATLFERLTPERTGIAFSNTLPEDPAFNIVNYLYYYNGGGVAVGDVDDDGLQDLYFSANVGPNRLYRNLGDYRFEDMTERAGVAGPPGWKTGVTMADVNGDGHVDIHVSAVRFLGMQGHNVLYVNRGDGTFADSTDAFGLTFAGYSTQATFFDYDVDGDLDMYLLNHSTHTERGIGVARRRVGDAPSEDILFRNDGGRFTNVTDEAGLRDGGGFGLGVVASDLNDDGCPDLYVANDFQEDDYLYVNNCNGTFTERIKTATGHTSRFSMGVDAADMNNDGRPDVFVADMLPEREEILKTSASSESPSLFDLRLRAGYHPQYPRNTLQLNQGGVRFSEIGFLSGTFASDWSWAPLFADLDNDGRKDLFVTSGIFRRPNDLDYINYLGNEAVQDALARGDTAGTLAALQKMPQVPLPNRAYHNEGHLRFTDRAAEWGLATVPGYSNGAAYVDLTNSGQLDLVVNAINAPAGVYRNRARERNRNGFVRVDLRGAKGNRAGIGATVMVASGGTTQWIEQSPTRGFQSSVDPRLHVGVGAVTDIDSVVVVWPDRRFEVRRRVPVNTVVVLAQDSASGRYAPPVDPLRREPWQDRAPSLGAAVQHVETPFLDYNREPLMTSLLSTEGPALAVGDMTGDGLDDVFVGGAKWQAGRVLAQRRDGTFATLAQPALQADSLAEDVDATLFDADGDGDDDLFVVSGGNEFSGNDDALRSRLYLNDGRGRLTRDMAGLPPLFGNGGCVAVADYDGDGDQDLFLGHRVVSRAYGRTPTSYLLRNEGKGRFVDVTNEVAPDLGQAGMVAGAAWLDVDGDSTLDLVVVGEWMPIRVFRQEQGRFAEARSTGFEQSNGWWNSVTAADVDGDGTPDLVLGNLGRNTYLRAAWGRPATLLVGDFFGTGTLKQVLEFHKPDGRSYPIAGRDELLKLMPALRSRFPSFASFGASTTQQIFGEELRKAEVRWAYTFESMVALHRGSRFILRPLPTEAQFAPIYASVVDDLDGDGATDVYVAGNLLGVTPMLGRYDASRGLLLRGKHGDLVPSEPAQSGMTIDGEVRAMAIVRRAGGGRRLAVARNNATLQLFDLPRAAAGAAAHTPEIR